MLSISSRSELGIKSYGERESIIFEEFNPFYNQHQKAYIGANIPWKAKILISQLRTNSHQLRCETRRWKRPKEAWAERVCIFCTASKVEIEKYFILECEAFKDNSDRYANVLTDKSWDDLFNKGTVEKLGALIIKLNRQRIELQKTTCVLVYPIGYS